MSTETEKPSTGSTPEKNKIDYDAKARVILLVTKEEVNANKNTDLKVLIWEGAEFGTWDADKDIKPTNEEIDAFLEKNKDELHHGDILTRPDTYRASGVLIVNYDEDAKKFTFGKNPDESGSGYLTLPAHVLKNVTNVMEKYEDVFDNRETSFLNVHISPKDEFIKERLGDEVPAEWQMDLHIQDGEVQEAYVKINKGAVWKDFDIEDSSIESIQALFDKGEKASFTVRVVLKDEKLEAYKKKYGSERAKYGWMQEKPILPKKWMAEKGSSAGGSKSMSWEWTFSGPKDDKETAKKAVEKFLDGFTYSYK